MKSARAHPSRSLQPVLPGPFLRSVLMRLRGTAEPRRSRRRVPGRIVRGHTVEKLSAAFRIIVRYIPSLSFSLAPAPRSRFRHQPHSLPPPSLTSVLHRAPPTPLVYDAMRENRVFRVATKTRRPFIRRLISISNANDRREERLRLKGRRERAPRIRCPAPRRCRLATSLPI